ncbi:reverse transcriptase domain, reverse transcriptase zinc-binding domain protein [Tanacetum coccineum]
MRDFRDCVEEIEVSDVQFSGLQFTWNQKPQGGIGIMKKLDRIMVNDEFRDQFMGAHAIFKPYRISDHSPSVLCIPTMSKMKPKPFKFFNVLTSHDRFLDVIKEEWTHYISGFHMYRVVKKLKNLKKPLRKLMYDKGNLHSNVTRLRDDLDVIQAAIDSDPFNMTFRDREAVCIADFNQAVLMEERFLKQKAMVTKEGDMNEVNLDNCTCDDKSPGPGWSILLASLKKAYGKAFGRGDVSNANSGKRGLRQGDPLSPYLFTLVMEVLTLMLQRRVSMTEGFTYHRYCSKMDLINLCFADDLFLFAYGDVNSASIIKESLDEFKNASGLVPSLPKSTAYFCNVLNHVKLSILQILPFEEGRLPVKYLGVPLVSSRLMVRDCNELIDKVQIRVQDWKNKALSIAGRLQLIQSVLGSMHIYWASVFTLPSSVLLNIEQILRQFLWNHGSSGKAKSKVAWEIVCLPKDEGGLGIRRLECFNSALMASHIWKLLTLKESLWVKWIHEYKLKGRNFWDYPMRGNMSWGWRKILRLRPVIRRFIWSKLGNGHATSLWFDKWSTLEPLANFVSPRDVARAGLSLKSKVSDVLVYGNWSWPNDLVTKYPILPNYNTPINNELDRLVWSDRFGNIQKFSVSQVWSDIRSRNTKVDWYSMVWFPSCIPRHAINMWLIIRRKLKTQDLIPYWDVSSSLGSVCSLCELTPDSHVHLFFECPFASDVWNRMRGLAGLNASNSNIYDIIHDIMPFVKRRTSESVVAKLVVAATAYYIWQERNWRLFQKGKRKVDQIVDCIKTVVRLKLLSCKLKKSKSGERLARLWDLPDAIFI